MRFNFGCPCNNPLQHLGFGGLVRSRMVREQEERGKAMTEQGPPPPPPPPSSAPPPPAPNVFASSLTTPRRPPTKALFAESPSSANTWLNNQAERCVVSSLRVRLKIMRRLPCHAPFVDSTWGSGRITDRRGEGDTTPQVPIVL